MEFKENKNLILFSASLIIILVVVISFSYINKKSNLSQTNTPDDVKIIQTQSNNDDVNSIETDLNQTDLQNIDKELNDIDAELNSSI
jgi:uncharacterized membrane protein YhiD involved in acid resistance